MAYRNGITRWATAYCCLAGLAGFSTAAIAGPETSIAKYDKDHDQTLDLAEVKAAAAEHFDKLNQDGDATLDSREAQGVLGKNAFQAADPDNDGSLSKEEYLSLAERLFKQTNPDNDGTLDAAELKSKSGVALRKLIT